MYCHLAIAGVLANKLEQKTVIGRATENRLTIVATLNHVVRVAGKAETGKTGHKQL
jgi:hypothetical protein